MITTDPSFVKPAVKKQQWAPRGWLDHKLSVGAIMKYQRAWQRSDAHGAAAVFLSPNGMDAAICSRVPVIRSKEETEREGTAK